jgi:hypothetical protein
MKMIQLNTHKIYGKNYFFNVNILCCIDYINLLDEMNH